jgi:hypothetical protein
MLMTRGISFQAVVGSMMLDVQLTLAGTCLAM